MKFCAQKIREIRRSKDLTQEYMAFEMGISQKTYSDIENDRAKISMKTLMKISEILKINASDICPLSNSCLAKYNDLLDYLNNNNISVPIKYQNRDKYTPVLLLTLSLI